MSLDQVDGACVGSILDHSNTISLICDLQGDVLGTVLRDVAHASVQRLQREERTNTDHRAAAQMVQAPTHTLLFLHALVAHTLAKQKETGIDL